MAVLQEKTPLVSIIIINYLTWQTTLELLKSLGEFEHAEVIVVDNGPDSALEAPVKKSYPSVNYYKMNTNRGYAAGVNKGVELASGEWIMILNNDMTVRMRDIFKLLERTTHETYLVSAPRLMKSTTRIQDNVGYFDGFLTHPINYVFARPRLVDTSFIKSPIAVDLATGGAMLIHKSVFEKVGLWDARFFMYFEDIDFGLRLKKEGIPVLYVPEVKIHHIKGYTADKNPKQKIKNYITARNWYVTKHRGKLINFLNLLFNFYGIS